MLQTAAEHVEQTISTRKMVEVEEKSVTYVTSGHYPGIPELASLSVKSRPGMKQKLVGDILRSQSLSNSDHALGLENEGQNKIFELKNVELRINASMRKICKVLCANPNKRRLSAHSETSGFFGMSAPEGPEQPGPISSESAVCHRSPSFVKRLSMPGVEAIVEGRSK
ncbi:hypothetical protein R3P38DRAFT_2762386 [Favolaschia claudopus]|uniref:Uncharacterized protein n=1 Tax=Favolaschia claudopus TaxID=2862362 RepID=A0AAW0DKS4_9AGAR